MERGHPCPPARAQLALNIQMKEHVRAEAPNAGKMPALPKDAAAIILLRLNTNPDNPEVYLVKRSSKLAFLGGFQAFPGGQRETGDGEV
ncbi:MAG: hypothetical protein DMF70_12645, partial [Acidobacteria bacterium]